MNLLPYERETIVVSKSAEEVLHHLKEASTKVNLVQNHQEHTQKIFVGSVHKTKFQLSTRPKRPNSFIPVMNGEVESTSSGSIVFINYTLYRSTRMYLVFWSVLVAAIGIVSSVQVSGYFMPSICALVLTLIHFVAWANFKMQVRITRDTLMKSLSQ